MRRDRRRTWLAALTARVLLAAACAAFVGVAPACDWFNEEDFDGSPVLDIEPEAPSTLVNPTAPILDVQVHANAGSKWRLGLRLTDGTLDTPAGASRPAPTLRTADSAICVDVDLSQAADHNFVLPVALRLQTPPEAPVLFAVLETTQEAGAECAADGSADSGPLELGSLCGGCVVKSRAWPPTGAATTSDASTTDATTPTDASADVTSEGPSDAGGEQ